MRLKAYCQLVRLPNVFTAAADSLAGFLIAGGSQEDPRTWAPLAVASMAIYAAGIALNDLFDLELDREERPGRPLPSGRVSTRAAALLGVGLFAVGLGAAASVGPRSAGVAVALVAAVVCYDAGVRRTVLGPELMGACRGLDVLLGLSVAADYGGPIGWSAAAGLTIFIIGVTWISRHETRVGERRTPTAGLILQAIGVSALLAAAIAGMNASTGSSVWAGRLGLLVLGATAIHVLGTTGRAVGNPRPETLQRAVKAGVLSLIWLHVGVVASVRGIEPALLVAALWVPARLAARWIYST